MRKIDWGFWACVSVALAGGALFLYVLFRFALSLFLPFLLALALGVCTRPAVRAMARKTGCSKRFCAVVITLAVLVAAGALSYLLCHRLLLEMQRLLDFLIKDSADPNGKMAGFLSFFERGVSHLPLLSQLQEIEFIKEMIGDPAQYLISQLGQLLSTLTGQLAGGVAGFLRRLPGVLFFLLVSLIACFYFAVEYERVRDVILRLLPSRVSERLPAWRRRVFAALKRCLRAYFVLFLLTLVQLSLGFYVLQVAYPFLIALLGAALDILPVLGVGTLLIPWAIFLLITGETLRGVGFLILYVVITIVRQIAEPHLVGKSLGLHPLLMLMAFYVGIKIFGVAGIVWGPLLMLLIKALLKERAGGQTL